MAIIKPRDKSSEIDNVVITCMDHRYQEPIRVYLKDKHNVDIDHVDRLAIGGPSKAVVEGVFTPSLLIASDKHHAKKIWLFDHIDCGGFGGLSAFGGDDQKEAQEHFKFLDQAQEVINKELPELEVATYVIGLDGEPVKR